MGLGNGLKEGYKNSLMSYGTYFGVNNIPQTQSHLHFEHFDISNITSKIRAEAL